MLWVVWDGLANGRGGTLAASPRGAGAWNPAMSHEDEGICRTFVVLPGCDVAPPQSLVDLRPHHGQAATRGAEDISLILEG